MRNLQKLPHARPTLAPEAPAFAAAAAGDVARRERHVWLRRAKRLATIGALVAFVWAAFTLVAGLRRTADGLVVTNRVMVTAPGRVRVAEVFTAPNRSCRRGDAILRIEPVDAHPERERLAAAVETKRARVRWYDAGGEVEELGRTLRVDLAAEAERQADQAAAELELAQARVASLQRERERLRLEMAEESERRHNEVATVAERGRLAAALRAEAEASLRLAAFDADAADELRGSGILAERDMFSSQTRRQAASSTVEALEASELVAGRELHAASALAGRFDERVPATLAHLDARIQEALAQLEATRVRGALWRRMHDHHAALDAQQHIDADELRELRRDVLLSELAEAEAALAAFDYECGFRTIEASTNGQIDRIFVNPGDVVAEGAELAVYHDPLTLRVVTYVTPDLLPKLAVGLSCAVAFEGREPIQGRIAAIGSTWVKCPSSLPRRDSEVVDLRIPVEVSCALMDRVERLAPNMRLKVTFARRAGWGSLWKQFLGLSPADAE